MEANIWRSETIPALVNEDKKQCYEFLNTYTLISQSWQDEP